MGNCRREDGVYANDGVLEPRTPVCQLRKKGRAREQTHPACFPVTARETLLGTHGR